MGLFDFLKKKTYHTASKQPTPASNINNLDTIRLRNFQAVCRQAAELNTDLLIMSVKGSTCPECAKYQGRVYSISGRSRLFPALPPTIKTAGNVHPGCHHSFFPYIHNVTTVHMDYTLQVHPLKNPLYGRDIITFSNRPFVDDRTEECKESSRENRERRQAVKGRQKQYDDIIAQRKEAQSQDYQDYDWLKAHLPDKCPASPSGYRRMKTQNTKNYQTLKRLAAEMGREI